MNLLTALSAEALVDSGSCLSQSVFSPRGVDASAFPDGLLNKRD